MFLLLFFVLNAIFAINEEVKAFQQYLNRGLDDDGHMLISTLDGGFSVVGSGSGEENDVILVKYDQNGSFEWAKLIHSQYDGNEYGYSILQSYDASFVVCGGTDQHDDGSALVFHLMKIKNDGSEVLWSTKLGNGTQDSICRNFIETEESMLVTTGFTMASPLSGWSTIVAIFDDEGSPTEGHQKIISLNTPAKDLRGFDIVDVEDGYVVTGSSNLQGNENGCVVFKITSDLQRLEWAKMLKSSEGGDQCFRIRNLPPDDDFLIAGVSSCSDTTTGCELFVGKFDSTGELFWGRLVHGLDFVADDEAQDVILTSDGGFLVGGELGWTDPRAALIKFDSEGGLEWGLLENSGTAHSVLELPDNGGYLAAGSSSTSGIFLTKVSESGEFCGNWDNVTDQLTVHEIVVESGLWTTYDIYDDTTISASHLEVSDLGMSVPESISGSYVEEVCFECIDHYYNKVLCDVTSCGGLFTNVSDAASKLCSGNGTCVRYNFCSCEDGYQVSGDQNQYCFASSSDGGDDGDDDDDDDDDENDGTQLGPDEVDLNWTLIGIVGGGAGGGFLIIVGGILLVIFCFFSYICGWCCFCFLCCCSCCCCLCCQRMLSRNVTVLTEREKFLLNETKVHQESFAVEGPGGKGKKGKKGKGRKKKMDIAQLNIDKGLFKIGLKEIKLIHILGEGGSNSTVYLADFNGVEVAFKGFKTSQLCSSQENFNEFEKEVSILGSLAHPNILQFYGAVLEPPRVGIVMEYCSNGDLTVFIKWYRQEYQDGPPGYPLDEKIRLVFEVAKAMKFLHSRKIIHRDLKCENVLITDDEHAKVMDFGCSKLVERMSVQKTKRVGTPQYMAPEVVLGSGKYSTQVDVFSYAMLVFSVLSERLHKPFGKSVNCIELKVANDPQFRPNVRDMNLYTGSSFEERRLRKEKSNLYDWIEEMVKTCWSHEPDQRFTFDEICDFFSKNT